MKKDKIEEKEIEMLKDFFLEYAKDDKLFKEGDKKQKMIFTAGFIRGASWALNKKKEIKNKKEEIKKDLNYTSKEDIIKT